MKGEEFDLGKIAGNVAREERVAPFLTTEAVLCAPFNLRSGL